MAFLACCEHVSSEHNSRIPFLYWCPFSRLANWGLENWRTCPSLNSIRSRSYVWNSALGCQGLCSFQPVRLMASPSNAEGHMEGALWDVVLIKKKSPPWSSMQLPVIRATCEKVQMSGINDEWLDYWAEWGHVTVSRNHFWVVSSLWLSA